MVYTHPVRIMHEKRNVRHLNRLNIRFHCPETIYV